MADIGEKNYIAKESTLQNMSNVLNTIYQSLGNSGGVKKVQRGVTTAAGTVAIEEVDMSKTVVYSVSKGSAGTVATSGTINMNAASYSGSIKLKENSTSRFNSGTGATLSTSGTIKAHTGTLSGGTTDLTVKEYSAVLTNSTTLTCDGPVEWQVVEYN